MLDWVESATATVTTSPKPNLYKPNQIVVNAIIQCDRTPICYPTRQRLIEMTCPNCKLMEVKGKGYTRGKYFDLQYCYCNNPRIMERRITPISHLKILNPIQKGSILFDPISHSNYYYHNEMVVENVIQCEPTPTAYCYKNRQRQIERKHPNYQIMETWRYIDGGGFELQYCYYIALYCQIPKSWKGPGF